MFWGDVTLHRELKKLVSPYQPCRVDRASYRLSIGEEVYVSPTGTKADPPNKPMRPLSPGQPFTIPPGQFGFILTEERVSVPMDAIALISMRAKYKFQGLVNVSGFHVDPGYSGRLLFSVFNSGPNAVHLHCGEQCFLIWYAAVDSKSRGCAKRGHDKIPTDLIGPLSKGVDSFSMLRTDIDALQRKVDIMGALIYALIPLFSLAAIRVITGMA